MDNRLLISKKCFITQNADPKTKAKVMQYIQKPYNKLPIARYNQRYKTVIIPVMSTVFLLGGYLVYQDVSTPIRIQNDITQTQTTINELVTIIDNQTF